MTDPTNDHPTAPDEPPPSRSAEQIRADIEQTREQLGETVEALAAKTDVKAHAQERVEAAKAQAQERVDAARSAVAAQPRRPAMIAGAVAAAVIVVWLLRR